MRSRVPSSIALRVALGDRTEDLAVALADADVTVGELCDELGLAGDVRIDGRPLTGDERNEPAVQRVFDGALLGVGTRPSSDVHPGSPPGTAVEVSVVAGLDAGARLQLRPGHYRIGPVEGRGDSWLLAVDGPAVSSRPARPWHEVAAAIETVDSDHAVIAIGHPVDPQSRATGYVHRPPRPLGPSAVDPIELEPPPAVVGDPPALSWATVLAPIPIAVLMAIFFRPLFALFAAMGPVVAIGRWGEGRRRHRRARRRFDAELARIRSSLDGIRRARAEAEAIRRWNDHPHVAALRHRAERHSARLWERRPDGPAYLNFTVGVGPDTYEPELVGARHDPVVHRGAGDPIRLRPVPHAVDLASDAGVGLHGPRPAALAVARSAILQLVTLHGPADLRLGLVARAERAADWDWLKWLPHLDPRLVAPTVDPVVDRVAPVSGRAEARPVSWSTDDSGVGEILLVVVDDRDADVAAIRRAAAESATEVRFIAIATQATFLPAACTVLVELDGCRARVSTPRVAEGHRDVVAVGVTMATAEAWARRLAPMRDPELIHAAEPTCSSGPSLLQMVDAGEPDSLLDRWKQRPSCAAPLAPVGVGPDGSFHIDLAADGPHALVAGTTGSGKSELLRTLVVSLAASSPPSELNFVLVDFKGGGAFDVCNRLPHVAGVITDLDQSLVERALHSLRAELQRREALLRSLGVSCHEQAVQAGADSIPRLVIVIDEFAALATDHAELLTSIVDLAARGRSLGMHLVLATQRPSGVVDQKIRANTNLRIALRVQDPHDSLDVVGTPAAAAIDRASPGRAVVSVGGDRPVTVQTAWIGAPDRRHQRCRVRPHRLGLEGEVDDPPAGVADAELPSSELQVMLRAIEIAAEALGERARPLWPEPLPELLDWIDLGTRLLADTGDADPGLALGLVDLPDQQDQHPWRWNPDDGSIALYAASATTAGSFVLSVAATFATVETEPGTHLYVIDGDAGMTSPLAGLPLTGTYVTTDEPDRIDRTIAFVEAELARRRGRRVDDAPRVVALIDNIASVLDAWDDVAALRMCDRLAAVARDGSPQRIHLVITARTARDLPHRLAQQLPVRLAAALADPAGLLTLGVASRRVVPLPAMRAIDLATHRVVQLVQPPELRDLVASIPRGGGRTPPVRIRRFPSELDGGALGPAALCDASVHVPIGVDAVAVEPVELVLVPGEHALIAGPPGSGRTACLRLIADRVSEGPAEIDIVWLGASVHDPPPPEVGRAVDRPDEIARIEEVDRPTLVLVDDADRLAPELSAAVETLSRSGNPMLHLVVAATPDHVRSLRSNTAPIRAGGTGIILGGSSGDGDLLRVALTRLDGLGRIPGRGHLVSRGRVVAVQVARPAGGGRDRHAGARADAPQPSARAPGPQLW